MAKLYYRGMAAQNGKPKLGRSARLLGIRPVIDIDIEQKSAGCIDEQGYLKPEAECDGAGEAIFWVCDFWVALVCGFRIVVVGLI